MMLATCHSETPLPFSRKRHSGRSWFHAHGERDRLCKRRDRAVQWRESYDDIRQRHAGDGGHHGGRHRDRWDGQHHRDKSRARAAVYPTLKPSRSTTPRA